MTRQTNSGRKFLEIQYNMRLSLLIFRVEGIQEISTSYTGIRLRGLFMEDMRGGEVTEKCTYMMELHM